MSSEARSPLPPCYFSRTSMGTGLLMMSKTGERRWAHPLTAHDPIDGPYDSGDFAAHIVGGSVALFEQLEEPEAVRFELISLADGASTVSAEVRVEDAGDYIRGVTWGSGTAWLAMDELYAVSLESGATVSRWP